ncbi:MAG: DNA (cytosine-5-)-methyltransferase [Gammaproteobacteria bacterium]|nr:DNA (cytosine-5-)-methyltransferase [Gammaproteobacteria bacterium]
MSNSASSAPVAAPGVGAVIDRVDEILEATYLSGDLGNVSDVLAETVYILLSRQTRETVYQRVYSDLRRRFTTWEQMLRARPATLERIIRPAGLGQQRAAQLRALLREVDRTSQEFHVGPYGKDGGDLTLEFLRTWSSEATVAFLEKLPGIGPKSARCVLAYALGEDRFAVDTHARRILGRLGIVDDKPGKPNHDVFEAAIPRAARVRLHVNLVHHGRAVCRESAPRCEDCPLISFCVTGRSKAASIAGRDAVVDLFGGAGAMGLGFKQAGFRIAAAVEIERHAAQTYRLNHPGVPVFETSVEDVTGEALRSWLPGLRAPAVVMAGPPCQGYSAAGARTIGDRRNLLFRHVSRLARELGARSVLIENVPGVRRVNGVTYTERITATLRRSGFATWKHPAVLRASDFGVSQNRRRLFFVGVGSGVALPEVPVPTHIPPGAAKRDRTLARTVTLTERLRDLPNLGPGEGSERLQLSDGRLILNSTAMKHSPRVVAKIKAIAPGGGPISYRRLEGDVARTLVAGHRALPVHPTQHRAITVREAARIQGFPDTYFFCGPRASQPLQVANAVPPALARAVARELRKSLGASEAHSDKPCPSAVA